MDIVLGIVGAVNAGGSSAAWEVFLRRDPGHNRGGLRRCGLSPASQSFGNQNLNTTSAAQSVTLTNSRNTNDRFHRNLVSLVSNLHPRPSDSHALICVRKSASPSTTGGREHRILCMVAPTTRQSPSRYSRGQAFHVQLGRHRLPLPGRNAERVKRYVTRLGRA